MRSPPLREAVLATAVWTVAQLCGCVASSPRYNRSSDAPKITRNSYVVPRDWDYRKYYVVPPTRLKSIVDSYLGVRYRFGGESRKGMDCSGFVKTVFAELARAKVPRSSRKLYKQCTAIPRSRARPGDLVFFRGGLFNSINHVGIYMGGNTFAHAASRKGVTYSKLDEEYYAKHYAGTRRMF